MADVPAPPKPVVTAAPAPPPPAAPLPPAVVGPRPVDRHGAALRRLGTLMATLRAPLEVAVREEADLTVFTVLPPGLSADAVAATARRVAPCLSAEPPVMQATLRSPGMALVLTPLAGALIAAALPSGHAVALLELLALRAASPALRRQASRPPSDAETAGHDLRAAAVPPHARAVAESLRSFGPLTPAVLRDGGAARAIYLFLPPGQEPRTLAELASRLQEALVDAELGPVVSVVLRLSAQRAVLRALSGPRGSLLVVAGAGERLGRARLEVEQAASRLTAVGA